MRREEILQAAEQLFRHYGYAKTTVSDIADRAGIGVGTVYLEFESKGSIAMCLAKRCREAVLAAMQVVVDSHSSFSERWVELIEARITTLRAFIAEGAHGHDAVFPDCDAAAEVNREYAAREHRLVAKFLAQGEKAGAFALGDVDLAADVLMQIYLSVCSDDARSSEGERDRLATLHTLVLGGILRRL